MAKTIVVVGAGGTMGLSIARAFGSQGFNVGLIARNAENLNTLASQLPGVTVKTKTADVTKPEELQAALSALSAEFGGIDVVEYSPAYGAKNYKPALDVTTEDARAAWELLVGGALNTVRASLPELTEKKGALLFTIGASAMRSIPPLANIGIATSGLRNYVDNLRGAVAQQGVYVGVVYVGGIIKSGTPVDPDKIAELLFDMYSKRDRAEEIVLGPPPPGAPGGPPGGPGGPPPGGPKP